MEAIDRNESSITVLGPGEYQENIKWIIEEAPALEHIHRVREANEHTNRGFSDGRLMRFRAQIPAWRVWEAENLLGYNLDDKRDFRRYLLLHPEYIVSKEDTGRSGRIIIK